MAVVRAKLSMRAGRRTPSSTPSCRATPSSSASSPSASSPSRPFALAVATTATSLLLLGGGGNAFADNRDAAKALLTELQPTKYGVVVKQEVSKKKVLQAVDAPKVKKVKRSKAEVAAEKKKMGTTSAAPSGPKEVPVAQLVTLAGVGAVGAGGAFLLPKLDLSFGGAGGDLVNPNWFFKDVYSDGVGGETILKTGDFAKNGGKGRTKRGKK